MLLRYLVPLCTLLAIAACAPSASDAPASAADPTTRERATELASLATTRSWVGDLPCADCSAVETIVTLTPDGSFRRQGTYRGTRGGGDTILTDFGRWTHSDAGSRITLRGSIQAPEHFAVEADGALRLLDLEGQPIASALNYRLAAVPTAVTITHPARLVAAFQYLADAALAVECRSGLPFPVDMSAAYATLEARYLASGIRPGAPLVVRLQAHLAPRPAMEGSDSVTALVVDSVIAINAEDGCAALRLQDAIAAQGWRLVSLHDTNGPLPLPKDNQGTFVWDRNEGRFAGNSGCNRYSAMGTLRGTTLAVGPAIGTKMACLAPEADAMESRLLSLLSALPSLRLVSDTLVFSVGPSDVARFVPEAVQPSAMD